MSQSIFKGIATALITPFRNGEVDYDVFGKIIDWQIDSGIDALVICGTTGEGSTLSDAEHKECIRYAVERAAGRTPIIAGTGSNDTAYAISLTKYSCDVGADAMLVVTPYYNKATQRGLVEQFFAIADASTKPLIKALFSEVNPIPVKAAMAAMGYGEDSLRLPLTCMEENTRAVLMARMREQGLI